MEGARGGIFLPHILAAVAASTKIIDMIDPAGSIPGEQLHAVIDPAVKPSTYVPRSLKEIVQSGTWTLNIMCSRIDQGHRPNDHLPLET